MKYYCSIAFFIILTFSCYTESEYSMLRKAIFTALDENNGKAILENAAKIDINKITNGNSLDRKYLELKLFALTICGKYDYAFSFLSNEVNKDLLDYTENLALGLLAEKTNANSSIYYQKAITQLLRQEVESMSNDEYILLNYLYILEDIDISQIPKKSELNSMQIKLIENYLKNPKDELVYDPPLGYIKMRPIFADSSNDKWWKD